MGLHFVGFLKFQNPKHRRGTAYKYGRRKLEFPEIAQNFDCGGFMVLSGSLVLQEIG